MTSDLPSLDALADILNGPKPKARTKRSIEKHVSRDKLMRWAQANIGIDPEEMLLDTIPTPAHASMLRFANDDPSRFWAMIAELDKREEAERDSAKAFKDDNRRLFALCDQIVEDRERTAALSLEKQASVVAN